MGELQILVGLPASGKSTYAAEKSDDYLILSSDGIRKELYGSEEIQGDGREVFRILYSRARRALKAGSNVILDATHLTRRGREVAIVSGKECGAYITCVCFETPLDECKRRNGLRDRVVPEYVYDRMVKKYEKPTFDEGFDSMIFFRSTQRKK